MVSQAQFTSGSTEPELKPGESVLVRFSTGEKIITAESTVDPATDLAHLPGATPDAVVLATLPHPGLRFRRPLHLVVEREGEHVGVWSPDLEEFGCGPHLSAAIEDLQHTLIELYEALSVDEQSGRIGPGMTETWSRLQDWIEPRP